MQEELEKLRRQAKEMYSIEMKSCMDMVKVSTEQIMTHPYFDKVLFFLLS